MMSFFRTALIMIIVFFLTSGCAAGKEGEALSPWVSSVIFIGCIIFYTGIKSFEKKGKDALVLIIIGATLILLA